MPAPRKPTKLRLLEGNPRPCTMNPAEPKLEVAMLEPPPHLSPVAREAWAKFSAILVKMGVVTIADPAALEGLCEAYAEVRQLRATILAEGRTYEVTSREGFVTIRVRPETGWLADADRRLLAYLSKFGMTPADRSRVSTIDDSAGQPDWKDYA